MAGRHKKLTLALQESKVCRWCGVPTRNLQRTCKAFGCKFKTVRHRQLYGNVIDVEGIELTDDSHRL